MAQFKRLERQIMSFAHTFKKKKKCSLVVTRKKLKQKIITGNKFLKKGRKSAYRKRSYSIFPAKSKDA